MNAGLTDRQVDGKAFIAVVAPVFEINEQTAALRAKGLRAERLLPSLHKSDSLTLPQAVTAVLALLASPTAIGAPAAVKTVSVKRHTAMCVQTDAGTEGVASFQKVNPNEGAPETVRQELQALAFKQGSFATFPGTFAADLVGFLQAWIDTGKECYLPSVKIIHAGDETSCEIVARIDPQDEHDQVKFIFRYGDDIEQGALYARQYVLTERAIEKLFAGFKQGAA